MSLMSRKPTKRDQAVLNRSIAALWPWLQFESISDGKACFSARFSKLDRKPLSVLLRFKNVKLKSKSKRAATFLVCKVLSGQVVRKDEFGISVYSKNQHLVFASEFNWTLESLSSDLVGICLPKEQWRKGQTVQSVEENVNEFCSEFGFFLLQRLLSQRSGDEYISKLLQSVDHLSNQKKHALMISLFKNVEQGNLLSKQLSITLDRTESAISQTLVTDQIKVGEYLRKIKRNTV